MDGQNIQDWELLDAPKSPLHFLQTFKDDSPKDDVFTAGSDSKIRPKVGHV